MDAPSSLLVFCAICPWLLWPLLRIKLWTGFSQPFWNGSSRPLTSTLISSRLSPRYLLQPWKSTRARLNNSCQRPQNLITYSICETSPRSFSVSVWQTSRSFKLLNRLSGYGCMRCFESFLTGWSTKKIGSISSTLQRILSIECGNSTLTRCSSIWIRPSMGSKMQKSLLWKKSEVSSGPILCRPLAPEKCTNRSSIRLDFRRLSRSLW